MIIVCNFLTKIIKNYAYTLFLMNSIIVIISMITALAILSLGVNSNVFAQEVGEQVDQTGQEADQAANEAQEETGQAVNQIGQTANQTQEGAGGAANETGQAAGNTTGGIGGTLNETGSKIMEGIQGLIGGGQ